VKYFCFPGKEQDNHDEHAIPLSNQSRNNIHEEKKVCVNVMAKQICNIRTKKSTAMGSKGTKFIYENLNVRILIQHSTIFCAQYMKLLLNIDNWLYKA